MLLNLVNVLSSLTDTAYCCNVEEDRWYYFDDSSVTDTSEEQAVVRAMIYC